MKDYQTQLNEATNECCRCNQEFTNDNPCWNSYADFDTPSGMRHVDGVCKRCSVVEWRWTPSPSHERGE